MTPGQIPPARIAAWESAADLNATLCLIHGGDREQLIRTCKAWEATRGREAAERLWRDVVAGIKTKREAA